MKLPDAQEMRSIDDRAVKSYGMRSLQLMENAGSELARSIMRELEKARFASGRVCIFAGKGNNGGDGFVAARHLKNAGVDVTVYLAAKIADMQGDAAINANIWARSGGRVNMLLTGKDVAKAKAALSGFAPGALLAVDALFGTGLKEPVRGFYGDIVELINSLGAKVVAVDIPSGIDATTGAVLGCAVRADKTVTMALPKLGMYLYPGREYCGEIEVADIGVPKLLLEDDGIKEGLVDDAEIGRILRPRSADTHKGTYGHVLVVAGSAGKGGAAYMAGMGALRAGAGLVTLAMPEVIAGSIESKSAELMTLGLPQTPAGTIGASSCNIIKDALEGKSALVIGPGLGRSKEAFGAVLTILEFAVKAGVPVVIDADAVVALAASPGFLKTQRVKAVLTPHPGEMAALTGRTNAQVQGDRVGVAAGTARKTEAVVLLKGASTVIAAPDGRVMINPTGGANLATAGTGDVLAGIIGGFISQDIGAFDAAMAGAFIHGKAADVFRKDVGSAGMIATDLLPAIPIEMGRYTG